WKRLCYKAISKALGLQRTTVRAIIHKWQKHGTVVNLPRSGRPSLPKLPQELSSDDSSKRFTKDPTTISSKELQASLASVKAATYNNQTDIDKYAMSVSAYINKCMEDVSVIKNIHQGQPKTCLRKYAEC
ncbi:hypothetical protein L3Q82_012350, partial [Scortum barcoo]